MSGPVKSRQTRQGEPLEIEAAGSWTSAWLWVWDFGLLNCNFVISGRDERGIGGGASVLANLGLISIAVTPFVAMEFSDLFIP